jgi:hypothetical protein
MSVKNFKFVSPGVFINEIDNSFIPKSADAIGPVVIGRSRRGLAMQPVKVESYSQFVEMFGDTVPGMGGGDIWRDGNYQSPMYGTYAAKAFLNANVAPLTYVRLLGQQDGNNDSSNDGQAGWATFKTTPNRVPITNGGAYGLWLFTSGAANGTNLGTGSLAAVWYVNQGTLTLSGTVFGGLATNSLASSSAVHTASNGVILGASSTDGTYQMVVSGGDGQGVTDQTILFSFDDTKSTFVRKAFNTNPQLVSGATFYTSDSSKNYWLGQTYEQEIRDRSLHTGALGCLMPIVGPSSATPANLRGNASTEGRSGWFISQDVGTAQAYVPFNQQKLFRLVGRGHGEWLQENCKISIANVRASTTTVTEYGTFSVIIRALSDTDNAVQVMERFDNLSLDPTSPNYIARKIGDSYASWDNTERRLKTYGEYANNSKFVYVEMNNDVDAGATDPTFLPFGYFGPPRFAGIYNLCNTGSMNVSPNYWGGAPAKTAGSEQGTLAANAFVTGGLVLPNGPGTAFEPDAEDNVPGGLIYLSGGAGVAGTSNGGCTGSLEFPAVRLRNSSSDGGLSDPRNAFFGMQTTRTATSTIHDPSVADFHRLLYGGYTGGGGTNATSPLGTAGVEDYAYVFSLDNVAKSSTNVFFYQSGSRANGTSQTSASYTELLDAGYDKFTSPFYGGFDGFNIMKPDPLYNTGMAAAATNLNSYAYYTYNRAIDTVADPEALNMNLLTVPGLTHDGLTTHTIRVCEERGDALALIDLPNVYIPAAEAYKSSKSARVGTTAVQAATNLRDRRIDSSYGCTFYPWLQTRDEDTGASLWIPPSVAMMGVLASSERASQIWFAPAGFNRGGLTDGAAGIPITNVTQRLTSKERDTLYESNINPIASFPSSGIVVFGQKTLQERQSALDRINVRRLVIYMKKQISLLSTQVLFEQNVNATWKRFTGLIDPFLSRVQTDFGITDYRLILDESTTTPDLIDQNILYAKIMVKPARSIEYIAIDFVIMSTGASFDD